MKGQRQLTGDSAPSPGPGRKVDPRVKPPAKAAALSPISRREQSQSRNVGGRREIGMGRARTLSVSAVAGWWEEEVQGNLVTEWEKWQADGMGWGCGVGNCSF